MTSNLAFYSFTMSIVNTRHRPQYVNSIMDMYNVRCLTKAHNYMQKIGFSLPLLPLTISAILVLLPGLFTELSTIFSCRLAAIMSLDMW